MRLVTLTEMDKFYDQSRHTGLEFDILFISTVRTYCDQTFMDESLSKDMGFFTNPKLLNTAITRARYRAFLVGDPRALCSVGECRYCWAYIMRYCALSDTFHYHISFLEVMETVRAARHAAGYGNSIGVADQIDDIVNNKTRIAQDIDSAIDPSDALAQLSINGSVFTLDTSLVQPLQDENTRIADGERVKTKPPSSSSIPPGDHLKASHALTWSSLDQDQSASLLVSSDDFPPLGSPGKPQKASKKSSKSISSSNGDIVSPAKSKDTSESDSIADQTTSCCSPSPCSITSLNPLTNNLPQPGTVPGTAPNQPSSFTQQTTTLYYNDMQRTMISQQVPLTVGRSVTRQQIPSTMGQWVSTATATHLPNGTSAYLPNGTSAHLPNGASAYLPNGTSAHRPSGTAAYLPSGFITQVPRGGMTPVYHLPVIPTADTFQPSGHYYYPPATAVVYPGHQMYPGNAVFRPHGMQSHPQYHSSYRFNNHRTPNQGYQFIAVNNPASPPLFTRPSVYQHQPVKELPPVLDDVKQLIHVASISKSTLRHKIQFLHDYCLHALGLSINRESDAMKDYIKRSTLNAFQDVDESEGVLHSVSRKILHDTELKIESNYTLIHDHLVEFSDVLSNGVQQGLASRLDNIDHKLILLRVQIPNGSDTDDKLVCLDFMWNMCQFEVGICRKLQKKGANANSIFLEVKVAFLESKIKELGHFFEKNLTCQAPPGGEKNISDAMDDGLGEGIDDEVDSWFAKRRDDPYVKEYQAAHDRRMAKRLPSPTP